MYLRLMEEAATGHIYLQSDLPKLKALLLHVWFRTVGYKLNSQEKVLEAHFQNICMINPHSCLSAAPLQMRALLSGWQTNQLPECSYESGNTASCSCNMYTWEFLWSMHSERSLWLPELLAWTNCSPLPAKSISLTSVSSASLRIDHKKKTQT